MSTSEIDSEIAQNRIMELVAPVLQQIEPEYRAIFIAMAERLAGNRYRMWAEEVPNLKTVLIECAEREELIADKIEGLYPNAASVITQLKADNPSLQDLLDEIFGDYDHRMQFAIQAQGERRGAARWHLFAEEDSKNVDTYFECADLEIANAVELEKILEQNLI